MPTLDPAARFWAKVDTSGPCWLWTGSLDTHGYGHLRVGPRIVLAHRLAWQFATGTWPDLHVLHTCDTPRCVRFDHLFLGTDADNMADCVTKGRYPSRRGSRNGRARLTEADVHAIRAQHASGTPTTVLARQYGVHRQTILRIHTRQAWPHI